MKNIALDKYTVIYGEYENKKNSVTFLGSTTTPEQTSPTMGTILYPQRFKDGKIKARVKFDEVNSGTTFGVIFDYVVFPDSSNSSTPIYQYAGLSNMYGYICSNQSGQPFFSQGMKNLFEKEKEYELFLDVRGGYLSLYVNEVLVGSCKVFKLLETNIGLHFWNTGKVHVFDFEVEQEKPKAFVVMQFSDDYKAIYEDVIKTVCEEKGYEVIRGDESCDTGLIIMDIIKQIHISSVIIADITPDNPNVFYEVGYAHALAKPTILLSDKTRAKLPFDVSGFRTIFYDNKIGGKNVVEESLRKFLDELSFGSKFNEV